MSYLPMLIPGFESGLVQGLDDTLIPNDACASLINAYVWRKRLLKKGGHFLYGRLGRRQDAIAAGAGNLSYSPVEPGSLSYVEGGNTYTDTPTTTTTGTIEDATITYATGAHTAFTATPGVLSYNVLTDQFSPAMGIYERELDSINEEELIAFDRRMAYVFTGTQFAHLRHYIGGAGIVKTVEWTGTNSDFFSAANYYGALWATNNVPGLNGYAITLIAPAGATVLVTIGANNFATGDIVHISGVSGMVEINGLSGTVTAGAPIITVNINPAGFGAYAGPSGFAQAITHSTAASGDGIRWYGGTGWANFAPPTSADPATEYLQGCLEIAPFKDRLVCFNTWEGATYAGRRNYHNRIRWSASLSTPYYANVFPAGYSYTPSVWYQQPGAGGYLDAPTEEQIIGVEYLKDYILVLFERSSYALVYTGNRNLPFVFQKLNSEFGSESTHSLVAFDDRVLSVGNRGIYQVSTSGAARIDEAIPDVAFEIQNTNEGVNRVYGIRNFFSEVVFWAYRSIDTACKETFPNRLLLYNYANETWAIFKTSFTCFGTHIREIDVIWDDIHEIWDAYDVIWDDARGQSNNPATLAGNQQGYVFGLDMIGESSLDGNAISLTVESLTVGVVPSVFTCINHNLEPDDIIQLHAFTGTADVLLLNNSIFRVGTESYGADTFSLLSGALVGGEWVYDQFGVAVGEYWGGGKIMVIDNFEIVTGSFNPFTEADRDVRFGRADFLLNSDDTSKILVEAYVDKEPWRSGVPSNSEEIFVEAGTEIKKWYTTYPQTFGKMVQLRLLFSDEFMFEKLGDMPAAMTGVDISMCRLWFSKQ